MISRHRARTEKGGVGYSESPTVGGFNPSLPMNYDAMDAADMEAAWLGNVMKHCVNMGSIPSLEFESFHEAPHLNTDTTHAEWWGRTFWWLNGRCKGLSSGRSEEPTFGFFGKVDDGWGSDVRAIVSHLRTWAPSVLRTEGVEPFLVEGERIRLYSARCFPTESEEWLTIEEAARKYDRTPGTILQWVYTKTIDHIGKGRSALISDNNMKFRIDAFQSSKAEGARKARISAGHIDD